MSLPTQWEKKKKEAKAKNAGTEQNATNVNFRVEQHANEKETVSCCKLMGRDHIKSSQVTEFISFIRTLLCISSVLNGNGKYNTCFL